jgi:hypothetical protein
MALARVVTFEGVGQDRIAELRSNIEGGEQPEGMNASEIMILHDPDGERSLAIVMFENEADYQAGDAILSSMPTGDTPGNRTSVQKYEVAIRRAR